MVSLILRSLLTAYFLITTVYSQTACKSDCSDYHRICPAVKNINFYNEYKALHEAGSLGVFSKSPLPPPPDCSNNFYKYGCPRSCSQCTPCQFVDADFVRGLVQELEQKLSGTQTNPTTTCDPCTEEIVSDGNGQKRCERKYETIYEGECSCACGAGVIVSTKKCMAFSKGRDGQCVKVETALKNCPGGNPKRNEPCNNGVCTISQIVEKTMNIRYAESDNSMTYEALTESGQSCLIGKVEKSNNVQRNRNSLDTYLGDEIEKRECPNICLGTGESFSSVKITTDGSNGWDADYIEITVNGAVARFEANGQDIDDRETIEFDAVNQ